LTMIAAALTLKRLRWPVAVLLLTIGGVTGWWCWPRVDSRFVGKWRGYLGVVDCRTEGALYDMKRDGSLHGQARRGFSGTMKSWHAEKDLLVLGDSLSPGLRFAEPYLAPLARSMSLDLGNEERWQITSASDGELVLQLPGDPPDAPGKLILRRI